MLIVLAAEDQAHQFEVGAAGFGFEVADILESAEPARNCASRQGFAIERGDHTDHVQDFAAFTSRLGSDAGDIELPLFKTEGLKAQLVVGGEVPVLVRHRHAEDLRLGDDKEGNGMNGGQGSGRKNGALHALLSALIDEEAKVSEVAEGGIVPA